MRLHPEETEAAPWRQVDDAELSGLLEGLIPAERGVLLVDGRSGSGKTTFAERAALLLDVELGRTPEEAERFWDGWMGMEEPFLAADRPWGRAALVVRTLEVDGTPERTTVATALRHRPGKWLTDVPTGRQEAAGRTKQERQRAS